MAKEATWSALLVALCLYYNLVIAQDATTTALHLSTLHVPEQSGVLLLSQRTFDTALQQYQQLFVLFDSPARRGSLELFRAFANAAIALRVLQPEHMRFGTMDVLEPTSLPDRLNIVGLPALVRLRCPPKLTNLLNSNDEDVSTNDVNHVTGTTTSSAGCALDDAIVENYTGGRTSAELQRFMLAQPQRDVLIVRDLQALRALVTAQPAVVLVVVDGHDTQPYFDVIALAQTDASTSVYAVTTNRALLLVDAVTPAPPASGSDASASPSPSSATARIPALVLFRDFGATRVPYTGAWRKRALVRFLQLHKYSAVSIYTSAFSSFLYDPSAAAHVLLVANVSARYCDALLAQSQALAAPYTGALVGSPLVRFIVVPMRERALRSALFVADHHVPIALIVEDVSAPPLRVPLFGAALVAALESNDDSVNNDESSSSSSSSHYSDVLGAVLAERFPLVFQTSDFSEEEDMDGDMDDVSVDADTSASDYYRPGMFEYESAPIAMSPDDAGYTSYDDGMMTAASTGHERAHDHRALLEVAVAADTTTNDLEVSPWTLHRQQRSLVVRVATAKWLLEQQVLGRHTVIVSFSSPRCFACREFAAVLEQAAHALDGPTSSVVFAAVNVDDVDVSELALAITRLPSVFAFPRVATTQSAETMATIPAAVQLEYGRLTLADLCCVADLTLFAPALLRKRYSMPHRRVSKREVRCVWRDVRHVHFELIGLHGASTTSAESAPHKFGALDDRCAAQTWQDDVYLATSATS